MNSGSVVTNYGSIHLASHQRSPPLPSTTPKLSSPLFSAKFSQRGSDSIQPISLQPPRYVCDICGARFSRAAGLRIHIDQMHPKRPVRSWKFWKALQSTFCLSNSRDTDTSSREKIYDVEEEE